MIKFQKIYNLSIGYWSLVIGYYLEHGDRHEETRFRKH